VLDEHPCDERQCRQQCCPTRKERPCPESTWRNRARAAQESHRAAKGYRGRRNVYRIAKEAVMKAGQYWYRDRRQKTRLPRCDRPHQRGRSRAGVDVQRVHERLKKASIDIDRKVLAELAARQGRIYEDRGTGEDLA
jgi:large subunit ribosomal protein L20